MVAIIYIRVDNDFIQLSTKDDDLMIDSSSVISIDRTSHSDKVMYTITTRSGLLITFTITNATRGTLMIESDRKIYEYKSPKGSEDDYDFMDIRNWLESQ